MSKRICRPSRPAGGCSPAAGTGGCGGSWADALNPARHHGCERQPQQGREAVMISMDRRRFLQVTGLGSVLAGVALTHPAAADDKPLMLRSRRDIQSLDPGWMVGGMEIDLQYACLGSLAVFKPGESLSWQPSAFVESVEMTDDKAIAFKLKPGIKWSGGFG